ncbi:MAG: YiiG family protein [Tardiphaga sp.]
MISFRAFIVVTNTTLIVTAARPASAQTPSATEKLNAYVGCINRLSSRAFDSQARYFSWAPKSGPTGKERIIYGLYTIYDTSDCQKNVDKANTLEPRDAALEAAATGYVGAVTTLGPLLKEADDYYTQENYKDDKMAKGRALHPRLVAAWDAFAAADKNLRAGVEAINDKRKAEELAAIEAKEGRKAHYYAEALMIDAKRVLRTQDSDKPDIDAITKAVAAYEVTVKAMEEASGANGDVKLGSMFTSNAKSLLVTAKQLMRRIRDKVPYSSGDKMMLNAGSGWMVEGSPPRLLRDYNQLVDAYNSGGRI